MKQQILASELPMQNDGTIYHLNLYPEELADNVILVGDPGRVAMISDMFDSIEVKKQNRELITHTGMYKGKRISVISTGMGTDNIDIVLTELDALVNIDLKTRTEKEEHRALNVALCSQTLNWELRWPPHSDWASMACFGITKRETFAVRTLWTRLFATQAGATVCRILTAPRPRRSFLSESVMICAKV